MRVQCACVSFVMTNRTLVILIACILFAALLAGGLLWVLRPMEAQVRVTVDGKVYGTYDLHRDQTVKIAPEDGSWYNLLAIQDGTARITESDCANQICVHTPALTEDTVGIIVCLPHSVAVELIN